MQNNLLNHFCISAPDQVIPAGFSADKQWIQRNNHDIFETFNPSTGETIATVAHATEDDYNMVVDRGYQCFKTWRTTPAPLRGLLIRSLGDALRAEKENLAQLLTLEMGKIIAEARGEVQEMIDMCDFAVGLSRQLCGLTMHSERFQHRMYEQWHPLGAIGVITAFNFPMAVWAWNATIAAICGNVVIWKPSELTPLCAYAVQTICAKVMKEHNCFGVFNLVQGSSHLGEMMAADPRIALVSATGSTSMGKSVATTVSARLGRSLLELGGNNAIIIDQYANLDLATRAILFSAIGTAGQRCTSLRRLILHSKIKDELLTRLSKAYQHIRIGDPANENTLMGPLITESAVQKVHNAISKAQSEGGRIVFQGTLEAKLKEGKLKNGHFTPPVIVETPTTSTIIREETFGPLLYVLTCDNISEAIELQNNVPQGLSSALFTDNLQSSELFLSASGSDCGIANVNIGTSGAEIGGAFGGEKDTGGGREAGSDAWKAYMRRQTNTINWGSELPLAQGVLFG
jgi:aldehyde dehydrogenase (NAD+)